MEEKYKNKNNTKRRKYRKERRLIIKRKRQRYKSKRIEVVFKKYITIFIILLIVFIATIMVNAEIKENKKRERAKTDKDIIYNIIKVNLERENGKNE